MQLCSAGVSAGESDGVKIQFFLRPNGTVQSVGSDSFFSIFPTGNEVTRLSTIEFVAAFQWWEARLIKTDALIAVGKTRGECLKKEHAYVEELVAKENGEKI